MYLARKADPVAAGTLQRRGLVGLGFQPEERRSYPQRAVAAHVLGYAGSTTSASRASSTARQAARGHARDARRSSSDPFGRTLDVVPPAPERAGRDV